VTSRCWSEQQGAVLYATASKQTTAAQQLVAEAHSAGSSSIVATIRVYRLGDVACDMNDSLVRTGPAALYEQAIV